MSVWSDPASAPWQDKDTDQGSYTQNVAHQAPWVQHPTRSSEFNLLKSQGRPNPGLLLSHHRMLLRAQCTPKSLLPNKGQLEAEHEAEVTIGSQRAGWSLPSPPCNSPWLGGTQSLTLHSSSGVFPNCSLLLGFHLAASQQFFGRRTPSPLHRGHIFFSPTSQKQQGLK